MRVALVSQEYPPETAKGGIGSQTYAKAHGLAALAHEVHVVSRSPDRVRREYHDGDVHVTRIAGFSDRLPLYTPAAEWLTYSAAVAAEVAALHARRPLDVVDFPEWGGEGYLHLLNRTEWNYIPSVVQIHGPLVLFAHTIGWPDLDSDLYRVATEMEGTCLRRADAVFSSSAYSRDWCARHYGLTAERVPILHTGVDTRLFCPRPVPKEGRPTVVFAGRITRNKGADVLVEAGCQLAVEFPGLRLRLLGQGQEEMLRELRDRARGHGLPDLLDLPGFIGRHELPEHLARAHVFAGPSRCEGGPGLAYLEAMACGLPVVASVGTGAAEVVVPGETGLLVPPGDVGALAQALHRLLADSAARAAMGARARDYARERADSRSCLKRLEAFYAAVCGTTRAGRAVGQAPPVAYTAPAAQPAGGGR
jgi:glycosyltransferase involved in cell wall biosynthesis